MATTIENRQAAHRQMTCPPISAHLSRPIGGAPDLLKFGSPVIGDAREERIQRRKAPKGPRPPPSLRLNTPPPKRMFLLTKIFQLRDKASPGLDEKPFLDHLEDLRVTITRMALTLLIATVACFIFRNDLMDIIRKPVSDLYESRQVESLKDLGVRIDPDTWDIATKAARDASLLSPAQRSVFFEQVAADGQDLEFHVHSVILFRAALAIPDEEKRDLFVEALPEIDERMRTQLLGLLKGNPEADVDARGRLVLMQALNPTEGFMLSIKLAFFAGIVVSFPFLLYFLLQFTLPGLHSNERKALFPAMAVGFGLFLGGVIFAYYGVLPRVLEFFHTYSTEMGIKNEWRIGYYISFATQFTLIFGLAFELPVVVMTLVKLGIMNYEMMKRTRSYAILAIFVIAAVITPTPDAFTLCLLAMPMIVLYEICIWMAYFIDKKERAQEAEEESARMTRLLAAGPRPAPGTEAVSEQEDADKAHPEEDHQDQSQDHGSQDDADRPASDEFDFHEEADPGATEEGEEEDISDPWPEEESDDEDSDDEDQEEEEEDDGPPEDIPEEERNR